MIESYKDDQISFMNKKKYSRYKNIFRDDDINSFEPTDEQKLLFKQTYQKLYQTSPFDNPNEFCEYLNQLTELLQKASSIFKYNEELQDPQLIKNIISLLNNTFGFLLTNPSIKCNLSIATAALVSKNVSKLLNISLAFNSLTIKLNSCIWLSVNSIDGTILSALPLINSSFSILVLISSFVCEHSVKIFADLHGLAKLNTSLKF